jgi:hypothetical protein
MIVAFATIRAAPPLTESTRRKEATTSRLALLKCFDHCLCFDMAPAVLGVFSKKLSFNNKLIFEWNFTSFDAEVKGQSTTLFH